MNRIDADQHFRFRYRGSDVRHILNRMVVLYRIKPALPAVLSYEFHIHKDPIHARLFGYTRYLWMLCDIHQIEHISYCLYFIFLEYQDQTNKMRSGILNFRAQSRSGAACVSLLSG
jgi:hypothetical protein